MKDKMTPFQRFRNGLHQIREDTNEVLEEALAFVEVMALKRNSIEFDDGYIYVVASGSIDEVIPTLYEQIDRLERYKKQQEEGFN
jgi:hypothetical protein